MSTTTFEQAFILKEPNRQHLLRYMREAMGVTEVRWDDITPFNMASVRKYITSKVTGNSATVYFAVIKAFINQYGSMIDTPADNVTKQLKAHKTPSQNVFLTEDEVDRIERYCDELMTREGHRPEKDVLNAFLIECFCGARGIDVESFTEDNIVDGKLVYLSKKTHVLSKIPIRTGLERRIRHKPEKVYSAATKDRIVKRVCRKVGITQPVTLMYHGKLQTREKCEFIGFHSARRSFCTNLARRGVDIYTIAALANHNQNVAMTQRYIIPDTDNLSEEALAFFRV